MDKFNTLFMEYLDSLNKLKGAKKKHKQGEMTSEELFDIEYHSVEAEENFIKHLQK